MRLTVLAVGRLKDGPERALCERYAGRIHDTGRSLGFSGPEVVEFAESKSRRPEDRKADEAASIGAKLQPGLLIVLDELGRTMASSEFAAYLGQARDQGTPGASFVIGGADGLAPSLRTRASLVLSFGALTMPHQLVRVLVLEQLYRALTVLSGHPYHRS